MIEPARLAAALQRRRVADWAILSRQQELATVDEARGLVRRETCRRLTLVIHHDDSRGRGSARIELAATTDADATAIVDRAVALASSVVGPAWQSVPPGAPAAMTLLDPALVGTTVDDAAAAVLAQATRPPGLHVKLVSDVLVEAVEARTRAGLVTTWRASRVRVRGIIAGERRSLALGLEARRLVELRDRLDTELARASTDLASLAHATPPTPGPTLVVLTEAAMLHGGGAGVWHAFAAQADAVLERQGLTRYRPGVVVAAGADRIAVPLTIRSDGALDFGMLSAPLSDEGDAVRRFMLVDRGVAAGLALTGREAVLRAGEPNGGVRNLVVAVGTWDGSAPAGDRWLEVRRLRNLAIDPYTGDASLDIELGIEHASSGPRPITGGTLRLDLIATLARALRSREQIERAGYVGPAALAIHDVEVLS